MVFLDGPWLDAREDGDKVFIHTSALDKEMLREVLHYLLEGCVQSGTCYKVHITVFGTCEHREWHFLFLPLCNKPTIMNLLESQTLCSQNFME
jgi:hypothetical protein